MNRQLSSRSRKQRLPCDESVTTFLQPHTDFETEYEHKEMFDSGPPPKKMSRLLNGSRKPSDARDRQAQMDHNEQERGRRRELAIIYEMIRTCINEIDVHRHLEGAGKCPEKLSYPQLLQISCGMIEDEIHDMGIYERFLKELEIVERECLKYGVSIDDRPQYIPPLQRHKIVASVVDDVLKRDKECRNRDGDYAVSQRDRALEAHRRLIQVLENDPCLSNRLPSCNSFTTVFDAPVPLASDPSRRPGRRINRRMVRRPVPRNLHVSNYSIHPSHVDPSSFSFDQDSFDFPNSRHRRFALTPSTYSPPCCLPLPNVCSMFSSESYGSPNSQEDRVASSMDQEIVDEFFATAVNGESNLDDTDIIGCTGGDDLDDYAFDSLFDVISTEPADDLSKLPFQQ